MYHDVLSAVVKPLPSCFTLNVQLSFLAGWKRPVATKVEFLRIGEKPVPVVLQRHLRARRYILRVRRDGSVRLTIPRGGSKAFALEFAQKHMPWIEDQLRRRSAEAAHDVQWADGTAILFRGDPVTLAVRTDGPMTIVEFAEQVVILPPGATNFRAGIENHLWSLAAKELPPRTLQLAAQHQVKPVKVMVRSQRSRWGSCSPRGTISLNWRLIQAPGWVRDYLIIHELMHLHEMNHSARYWRLVETAFPDYGKAEAWLDEHAGLLR